MAAERGVSEVVGFVMVFSLVLATIALVYVGGFSGLEDARDHEQSANAERAFDVLANNLEEVARGKAPSRATEIKLADAQLTVDERTRSNVSVANATASPADGTPLVKSRPITYTTDGDAAIVHEYGAVIREQDDGARMLRQPDFVFSENRTVIRYVQIRGGRQNVGGSTTALVRGERHLRSVELHSTDHDNVTYQLVTSPNRAEAWTDYFEGELEGMNPECTTEPRGEAALLECTFETDAVYVARIEIDVRLVI